MRFRVYRPDHGQEPEDGRLVEAYDAQSAAAVWAHWSDASSADYTIVGGTPAEVLVRQEGTTVDQKFTVYGESVPQYRAVAA